VNPVNAAPIRVTDTKRPKPVPYRQPVQPAAESPAPGDTDRRTASGSICLPCRLSGRHSLTHACITRPDSLEALTLATTAGEWRAMAGELALHPARPLEGMAGVVLRGVHESWCFCQHGAGEAL
jgi:hypothetical protein